MSSSTRLTINGYRHYNCAGIPKPLPSVTSILSACQSEETQRKLAAWNVLNPGEADKAAERGSWIHNAVENYVRGLKVDPPANYFNYWKDVPEKLDEILEGGKILWSEKPFNKPEWNKYVGTDGVGRIHHYDEKTGRGWAGCCDIIYQDKNNEIVLADFKTSTGPYSSKFPSAKNLTIPEPIRKALVSGVFKLRKTQLQLAAYKIAAESCFGIKIDKTQIFVSTALPDYSTQLFSFSPLEIEKHEKLWLLSVEDYYNKLEAQST